MSNLTIYQKIESMIIYGYGAVKDFPVSERHVSSAELRNTMWEILDLAALVVKRHNIASNLVILDAKIEKLRMTVRVAMQLKFLSFEKYENWSKRIDEVGRIIGKWILNHKSRNSKPKG